MIPEVTTYDLGMHVPPITHTYVCARTHTHTHSLTDTTLQGREKWSWTIIMKLGPQGLGREGYSGHVRVQWACERVQWACKRVQWVGERARL